MVANAQENYVVPILSASPHVLVGLTSEKSSEETDVTSEARWPPQEESFPLGENGHYEVAVYDTGSPATILSRDAYDNFGIGTSGFGGTEITPIGGVGDFVEAINSDPLGTYVAGFDALLTNPANGQQTVDRNQLKGTITNSVAYASAGVVLPNLIGTNTSSFYTSVVNYGDPQIVDYNDETIRTPAVTLLELGQVSKPDRRIQMTLTPGALGAPAFLPNLAGGIGGGSGDFNENPSTPTVAGSFRLFPTVTNNGAQRSRLEAIFDTGAQATIVSEQIAAELGFDVINDDPDFVVRVAGVTGENPDVVPGFYADEFVLPGTDGGLVLENVPLVVFNLTDPKDGVNTLPMLIGMNLFSNRDLTINPQSGDSYLGISDPTLIRHSWNSQAAVGEWGNFQSWDETGNPARDWFADVTNVTGTPQTARITADSQISMLVVSGNPDNAEGTMTVEIEPGVTLTPFGATILQEGGTLHLNDANLSALSVEIRGGTLSGSGEVEGEVLNQGTMLPGGTNAIGTLRFPGSLDQLTRGTVQIELGDNSDPNNVMHDKVEVALNYGLDGKLEISTLDSYMQPPGGTSDRLTILSAGVAALPGSILDGFSDYSFNGIELEPEFPSSSDRRNFRDHIGTGQFVSIEYFNDSVVLENFQALPGDTDGNGEVVFDDFLILSLNFGSEADWTGGDFDGTGTVEFADFLELSKNYGVAVARATSVPEPSAIGLAMFGLVGLAVRRRRRHV